VLLFDHVSLVSGDPVSCDFVLEPLEQRRRCCGSALLETLVNHLGHVVFQPILHMGIPRGGVVGLGPQILDGVGAAKLETNQVIHFIIPHLGDRMEVRHEDVTLDRLGDIASAAGHITLLTEPFDRHVDNLSRCELGVGQVTGHSWSGSRVDDNDRRRLDGRRCGDELCQDKQGEGPEDERSEDLHFD